MERYGWSHGWLPDFANDAGDFAVVDLDAEGAVRHVRVEEADHPVEFGSLGDMVRTLAARFERQVFSGDADGDLELDDTAFGGRATGVNPHVA